jgi:hypothetical protein
MPEGLRDRLGVMTGRGHRKAEPVSHRMRVLLGDRESGSSSSLAEPPVEVAAGHRFLFTRPLTREKVVVGLALFEIRAQRALYRLADCRVSARKTS